MRAVRYRSSGLRVSLRSRQEFESSVRQFIALDNVAVEREVAYSPEHGG